MHYVYLLYSPSKEKCYIGYSHNVEARLTEHNGSHNHSTKYGALWKLVYYEAYTQKHDALAREKRLKHHARGFIELKKRITIERNGEGAVPR
jgi:putative endonuclease